MAQLTARVSDELEAALGRWAAEERCQRSDLVRTLLAEAVAARREGRAMFEHPEMPGPADVRQLVTDVRTLATEIDRVLRQNAKRDAELARQARADAVGVSDARAAIVGDLTAEMRRIVASLAVTLTAQPADVIAALVASPAMTGIAASLARLEEQPGFKDLHLPAGPDDRDPHRQRQRREGAAGAQGPEHVHGLRHGLVGPDGGSGLLRDRGGRDRAVPRSGDDTAPSWLALRTANQLLGGGDQAICALVDYRTATDGCRMRFEGKPGRMVVSPRVARQ